MTRKFLIVDNTITSVENNTTAMVSNDKLTLKDKKQQKLTALTPEYAVIKIENYQFTAIQSTNPDTIIKLNVNNPNIQTILNWLEDTAKTQNVKYIAVKIIADKSFYPIICRLWLEKDIVPYFTPSTNTNLQEELAQLKQRFDQNNLIKVNVLPTNEVELADLVFLEDYQKISNPTEFRLLLNLVEQFKGKKMVFFNATPQGGGVALMRHALIRLYRLLSVNAYWYVLEPQKDAFDITKVKFHNILQAVAEPSVRLTDQDKQIYNNWLKLNASILEDGYKDADVVIIDDPQPCGLIPYIQRINPKAKIIFRSHIQIVAKLADLNDTPQNITWQFIWNNIKNSDLFVSHPMLEFIPKDVPFEKTVMMPATTDALDGLNKPLDSKQIDYYLDMFNAILQQTNQTPLDNNRPYIIQIARFDPSKGIPDVIESYRLLIEMMKEKNITNLPQLVICGHGSIDDPDAIPIYNMIMEMLESSLYKHLASDIKVARLPSSDQLLNALMRKAKIAFQLSHKEGFEVKVSEALMKGIPIIVYRAGGLPLQVKNGISGYVVDVGNTPLVAQHLYELLTNENLYQELKKGALENINPETSTVSNAINWLLLAIKITCASDVIYHRRNVKELLESEVLV